jgi:hypothetical protein
MSTPNSKKGSNFTFEVSSIFLAARFLKYFASKESQHRKLITQPHGPENGGVYGNCFLLRSEKTLNTKKLTTFSEAILPQNY